MHLYPLDSTIQVSNNQIFTPDKIYLLYIAAYPLDSDLSCSLLASMKPLCFRYLLINAENRQHYVYNFWIVENPHSCILLRFCYLILQDLTLNYFPFSSEWQIIFRNIFQWYHINDLLHVLGLKSTRKIRTKGMSTISYG